MIDVDVEAVRRAPHSLLHQMVTWATMTRVALAFVVLALGALVFANEAIYRPRLDRSLEAARLARLSHEAMLDQQTGLRGYLLSGEPEFLEAFDRGATALPPLQEDLTELVGGDGRSGPLLVDLRVAQQRWIDEWAVPAAERGDDGDLRGSSSFLREDKRLFDVYRGEYEELITRLAADRDAALAVQRQALLIASLVGLTVALVAAVLVIRRANALRRAVDEPLRGLLVQLDDIRSGDFARAARREQTGAPAELEILGHGLRDTANALAAAHQAAERRTAELDGRTRRQAEVLRFAREVAGSLSLRYVLQGACAHAAAISDAGRASVWLLDETERCLALAADSERQEVLASDGTEVELGVGPVGQAAALAEVRRDQLGAFAVLAIPMIVGARVIGVLEVLLPVQDDSPDDVAAALETLAVHAATAIDAARLHEQTAHLAATDALTGLPNRRQLESDLELETTASARYQRPMALLMIDVDHFKSYNDEFGHQAGDVALQSVSAVLSSGLRSTDIAYRFGGEEFALVLRETSAADAAVLAERLRGAVEHRFAGPGERRQITVSVGIAALPGHGPSPALLVEAADQALYAAKAAGRNRVEQAPPRAIEIGWSRGTGSA